MLIKKIKIVFIFFISINSFAQEFIELNRQIYSNYEYELNKKNSNYHTAMKPYLLNSVKNKINIDSLNDYYPIHTTYKITASKFVDWLVRKTFQEHLLIADTSNFSAKVDPIFNIYFTQDNSQGKSLLVFSRGARIKGKIGEKLSYYTSFYESQGNFPRYVQDKINNQNGVVPGNGRGKIFVVDSINKIDYSMSEGYVSYSPSNHFNLFFGHGKNFVGDGYRSLLLSDNSFNYPFLKLTTNFGIVQYTNIFSSFVNLAGGNNFDDGYPRKNGSFHYLSINASKRFQFGLFEGIIWKNTAIRGFDINYLNPIIFFRPVEFALGSPDNAIIGLNSKYTVSDNLTLYGQAVIDDVNTQSLFKNETGHLQQKLGAQMGVKLFNLFKIKNLNAQAEFNIVRPYVYAHKDSLQAYTHHAQSLAHPLGANFSEIVLISNYKHKNWFIEAKINYAKQGIDTAGLSYGGNIFLSDLNAVSDVHHPGATNSNNNPITGRPELTLGHKFLDGEETTIVNVDLKLSYLVNPVTNLTAFFGVQKRTEKNSYVNYDDTFIYAGIRTIINNQYLDF